MSRLDDIKSELNTQLKQFEKKLISLEGQLDQSKDEAIEKLEILKQVLHEKAETAKARLKNLMDIDEDEKKALRAKIDILQLQLKLGKAEAIETLNDQKKKINIATQELKLDLNERIKGVSEDLQDAIDDLDAEFESVEVKFSKGKELAKDIYSEEKEKLKESFLGMKEELFELRKETTEKSKDVFDALKKEFTRLKKSIID